MTVQLKENVTQYILDLENLAVEFNEKLQSLCEKYNKEIVPIMGRTHLWKENAEYAIPKMYFTYSSEDLAEGVNNA